MRRARALGALALAALGTASGAAVAEARVERPIVYAVVIDGLDGDRIDGGRAPFISSLLAGSRASSTYYRESRSIMIAETNPNHTAMMTGAYGGASGIPGNHFAIPAPLENEDSCRATGPVDETRVPSPTSGENANCLVAQSTFEAIKRQGDPDGLLTAAIFGKPKLGRLFAGRFAEGRSRDVDHLWAPCSSGPDDDEYCGNVPTNPATGYAVDDRTVMDEVIRSAREGIGSERRRPDFTFVNLHQTDSGGHAFGTLAPPYDAAIGQADEQVRRLVDELRARGEWERTVLVLLSDHSMDTTLTRTTLTSRFESAGISKDSFLARDDGSLAQVWVARGSPSRDELLKRMREVALAQSGVGEALYRAPNALDGGSAHSIAAVHPTWRLAGPRTGDLVVVHRPGGTFSDPSSSSNPLPGNHGGPQTRDNFFAAIGGGPFVRQQDRAGTSDGVFDDTAANPGQAENVDLASTVMGVFGLFEPRDNAGRFLSEAFNLAALPGRGFPARRPRLSARCLSGKAACRVRRRSRPRAHGRGLPVFAGAARCGKTLRYRLRWSPAGGRYDLELRSGKRHRKLLRSRKVNSYVLKARRGKRQRLRIRSRSAAGTPSTWSRRALRPPRC